MKAVELLKISTEILRTLSENGIRLEDYRYIKTYDEYLVMRSNNVKYDTAMRILSEDCHIGVRTLARIFKRLGKDL